MGLKKGYILLLLFVTKGEGKEQRRKMRKGNEMKEGKASNKYSSSKRRAAF